VGQIFSSGYGLAKLEVWKTQAHFHSGQWTDSRN